MTTEEKAMLAELDKKIELAKANKSAWLIDLILEKHWLLKQLKEVYDYAL